MRFTTILALAPIAALLGGCAVAPPAAWTFDPTHPQPKPVLEASQAAALTDRVAQLQLQRNDIRTRIASELDIWKRQDLYSDLHAVGMRLSRAERRLSLYANAR
jgi:hypothetical protein